jgi:hypothetical protein
MDVRNYIYSYERIAVWDNKTQRWQWFDLPVTRTLRHLTISLAILEEQAQRANSEYGATNCRLICLRAYGEDMRIDWDRCLASINNEPEQNNGGQYSIYA